MTRPTSHNSQDDCPPDRSGPDAPERCHHCGHGTPDPMASEQYGEPACWPCLRTAHSCAEQGCATDYPDKPCPIAARTQAEHTTREDHRS